MSEELVIALDFTETKNPALGMGIAILPQGPGKGIIREFKKFDGENGKADRLFCYMETDGLRHRDSYNLDKKGMPFLAGLIVSAGVNPAQFVGKKIAFPFHKLVGKLVHFYYTPPQVDENGNPKQGSYAQYNWLTKEMYDEAVKLKPVTGSNGAAAAAPTGGDDFQPPAEAAVTQPAAVVAAAPVQAAPAVVAQPVSAAPVVAPVVVATPAPAAPAAATNDFAFLDAD